MRKSECHWRPFKDLNIDYSLRSCRLALRRPRHVSEQKNTCDTTWGHRHDAVPFEEDHRCRGAIFLHQAESFVSQYALSGPSNVQILQINHALQCFSSWDRSLNKLHSEKDTRKHNCIKPIDHIRLHIYTSFRSRFTSPSLHLFSCLSILAP